MFDEEVGRLDPEPFHGSDGAANRYARSLQLGRGWKSDRRPHQGRDHHRRRQAGHAEGATVGAHGLP